MFRTISNQTAFSLKCPGVNTKMRESLGLEHLRINKTTGPQELG